MGQGRNGTRRSIHPNDCNRGEEIDQITIILDEISRGNLLTHSSRLFLKVTKIVKCDNWRRNFPTQIYMCTYKPLHSPTFDQPSFLSAGVGMGEKRIAIGPDLSDNPTLVIHSGERGRYTDGTTRLVEVGPEIRYKLREEMAVTSVVLGQSNGEEIFASTARNLETIAMLVKNVEPCYLPISPVSEQSSMSPGNWSIFQGGDVVASNFGNGQSNVDNNMDGSSTVIIDVIRDRVIILGGG